MRYTIPYRAVVLDYTGEYFVLSDPVGTLTPQFHDWTDALEYGDGLAQYVGCELFLSELALDRIALPTSTEER